MNAAKLNHRKERTQTGSPARAIHRRDFLAKSAAMTLFGTMGLDAVLDAVMSRLQEMESTRELARAIAHQLQGNGLSGRALADETASYVCPDPAE